VPDALLGLEVPRYERFRLVWWLMLVIPATQEGEVGGSWPKLGPRQKYETLSENKLKEKGLGAWFRTLSLIPRTAKRKKE
jgi:hypothetical protein